MTKTASQLDREIADHLANKSRMSDAEVLRSVARAKTAHKAARTKADRTFNTAANEALSPRQRTSRHASESPADGDRKVIPFRANVAAAGAFGLQGGDTSGGSNIIRFRPRQHGPRNWHAAAASHAANAEKSFEEKIGNHESAAQADDDHSHRMVVNFLAAAVSIMLIIAGDWMVNALIKMP